MSFKDVAAKSLGAAPQPILVAGKSTAGKPATGKPTAAAAANPVHVRALKALGFDEHAARAVRARQQQGGGRS
jgi:hypothetical protein